MALDNAEFISELSITDPPGTDPLNQGDDHIRTTKKAVQQSFPNVGSAVPQSGAQMAQMAIKNEINAFTQPNTFPTGQEFTGAITLKQPGTDVTDIHYRNTLGAIRWIVRMQNDADSNDLIFQRRNSSGVIQDVPITIRNATGDIILGGSSEIFGADGNATVPAYSFNNQSDMGMFRAGSLNLAFAVGGVEQLSIRNDEIRFTQDLIAIQNGSAASPVYTFFSNPDMGMFRTGANQLGFATAGVERMNIDSVGMTALARVFFRNASDTSGFRLSYATQAGVNRWQWIFEASNTGIPFHLRLNRFNSSGVFAGLPIAFDPDTGQITMGELPTTNPGGTGILWKSGGFIAIT